MAIVYRSVLSSGDDNAKNLADKVSSSSAYTPVNADFKKSTDNNQWEIRVQLRRLINNSPLNFSVNLSSVLPNTATYIGYENLGAGYPYGGSVSFNNLTVTVSSMDPYRNVGDKPYYTIIRFYGNLS